MLALLAAACRPQAPAEQSAPAEQPALSSATPSSAAPPPASAQLRPVSEPAAPGASAAVRDRLRAQYAALTALQQDRSAPPGSLADAFGSVGKLLVAADYPGEAQVFFENAERLAPRETRWPYYLGHVYRLQHQPEPAIAAFERARALNPGYAAVHVWLGNLYLDQGRNDEAVNAFDRALAADSHSAAALFGAGRAALAKSQYATAVTRLEAALAADPRATGVHYALATAYRARGDAGRADAHLRLWKDSELAPSDPLLAEAGAGLRTAIDLEIRGTRALERGRYAEAIAAFREGLTQTPDDAPLHLNLGTALYLSGNAAAAATEFERAAMLAPGNARTRFALGLVREERGDDEAAIAEFTQAVRIDPSFNDARLALGNALRRRGRPAEAVPHYEAVVAADPGASQARLGQAFALVQLGRFDEARAALTAAATASPEQPGLAHALARVLAAAPDAGARDGAAALRIMQDLVKAVRGSAVEETMAMALAENGRYDDAVQWQQRAMASASTERGAAAADQLRDNLRLYQQHMPCRTPWRADDPVFRPRASGIGRR